MIEPMDQNTMFALFVVGVAALGLGILLLVRIKRRKKEIESIPNFEYRIGYHHGSRDTMIRLREIIDEELE